jgi:hypothetical protein
VRTVNFEVKNALAGLDSRTPDFLVGEALADANPKTKNAAAQILRTVGDQPSASAQLRSMLRLY